MILAIALPVAGCEIISLPPDPNAGAETAAAQSVDEGGIQVESGDAAAIPDSWPASVPVYEGGTLMSAEADGLGSFQSANYAVTATPGEVLKEYGDLLVAAGLTAGDEFVDETSALNDFAGDGVTVSVFASVSPDDEATTELSITVQAIQ